MSVEEFLYTGKPAKGTLNEPEVVNIDLRNVAYIWNYTQLDGVSIAKCVLMSGATVDLLEDEPFEVLEAWKLTLVDEEEAGD